MTDPSRPIKNPNRFLILAEGYPEKKGDLYGYKLPFTRQFTHAEASERLDALLEETRAWIDGDYSIPMNIPENIPCSNQRTGATES